MSAWRRLTPRASLRTRLFLAAVLWSAIGAGLLAAGLHWLLGAHAARWLAVLPLAMAAGWFKGRFLLAPRAAANAARIVAAGEPRCVGGVFSWRSWLLALGMMAGGAALRHSPIPRPWLGVFYATVGAALLVASLGGWARWREYVRAGTGSRPA
jgi:hypothetical protein